MPEEPNLGTENYDPFLLDTYRGLILFNFSGLDVSVPELFRPRLARVKSTKTSRSQSREAMATSRAESVPQVGLETSKTFV